MKQPTLMQQSRVQVTEVITQGRLRPVSEAGVESLIASVGEIGVMKDAIHLRKKKDGKLYLIAGAHRLEAARRMGWDEVEAKVWTDVSDDWARMMEIDDNLAGAEMNALDTAVFLATRKEVYERIHPETRRGVAGALARWDATEPSSVAFVKSTSEKFGMTERQVYKIVAAGASLHADQIKALRAAPRPVTLKDLTEIARIGEPTERYDVVTMLAGGGAKSAAEARSKFRQAANGDIARPKDPVDDAYLALTALWVRAPKAARRRFVDDRLAEIEALIASGRVDGGDSA